jgi:hypothetical protein
MVWSIPCRRAANKARDGAGAGAAGLPGAPEPRDDEPRSGTRLDHDPAGAWVIDLRHPRSQGQRRFSVRRGVVVERRAQHRVCPESPCVRSAVS